MIQAAQHRAPITGGSFATWGLCYSTFDCSLMAIRGEDDMWNSIASGALTGGTLAIRTGPRNALKSAAVGGVILAVIEGIQLAVMKMVASQYEPKAPELQAPAPPPAAPATV